MTRRGLLAQVFSVRLVPLAFITYLNRPLTSALSSSLSDFNFLFFQRLSSNYTELYPHCRNVALALGLHRRHKEYQKHKGHREYLLKWLASKAGKPSGTAPPVSEHVLMEHPRLRSISNALKPPSHLGSLTKIDCSAEHQMTSANNSRNRTE